MTIPIKQKGERRRRPVSVNNAGLKARNNNGNPNVLRAGKEAQSTCPLMGARHAFRWETLDVNKIVSVSNEESED